MKLVPQIPGKEECFHLCAHCVIWLFFQVAAGRFIEFIEKLIQLVISVHACVCTVAAVVQEVELSLVCLSTQRRVKGWELQRRPHKTPFVRSSPAALFSGSERWPVPTAGSGNVVEILFSFPAAVFFRRLSRGVRPGTATHLTRPRRGCLSVWWPCGFCRVSPRHLFCHRNIGPPCFSSASTDWHTLLWDARGWRRSQSVPS